MPAIDCSTRPRNCRSESISACSASLDSVMSAAIPSSRIACPSSPRTSTVWSRIQRTSPSGRTMRYSAFDSPDSRASRSLASTRGTSSGCIASSQRPGCARNSAGARPKTPLHRVVHVQDAFGLGIDRPDHLVDAAEDAIRGVRAPARSSFIACAWSSSTLSRTRREPADRSSSSWTPVRAAAPFSDSGTVQLSRSSGASGLE